MSVLSVLSITKCLCDVENWDFVCSIWLPYPGEKPHLLCDSLIESKSLNNMPSLGHLKLNSPLITSHHNPAVTVV